MERVELLLIARRYLGRIGGHIAHHLTQRIENDLVHLGDVEIRRRGSHTPQGLGKIRGPGLLGAVAGIVPNGGHGGRLVATGHTQRVVGFRQVAQDQTDFVGVFGGDRRDHRPPE